MATQVATRLDDDQLKLFKKITQANGTTPADALRMFVAAFNRAQGFPFPVTAAVPTREQLLEELITGLRANQSVVSSSHEVDPYLRQMSQEAQELGLK